MAGQYDEWKARDSSARERTWSPQLDDDDPLPVCKDCGATIVLNAHSHLTTEGTPRTVCERCYRWRASRLLVFDPRSKAELERGLRAEALAKGASR
jgi:hypothetical protein